MKSAAMESAWMQSNAQVARQMWTLFEPVHALTADGEVTEAGMALRAGVEHSTDVVASRPWRAQAFAAEVATALAPIARACAAELPFPNPVGVPGPAAAAEAGSAS